MLRAEKETAEMASGTFPNAEGSKRRNWSKLKHVQLRHKIYDRDAHKARRKVDWGSLPW